MRYEFNLRTSKLEAIAMLDTKLQGSAIVCRDGKWLICCFQPQCTAVLCRKLLDAACRVSTDASPATIISFSPLHCSTWAISHEGTVLKSSAKLPPASSAERTDSQDSAP